MKYYAILITVFLFACSNPPAKEENDTESIVETPPLPESKHSVLDIKNIYDSIGYKGCFVLFDEDNDTYYEFDTAALNTGYSPASTFKIFNSFLALESGTVPDPHFVLKWDGVKRRIDAWNADTDLEQAYKNSTVWFYQELARRMGKMRIKHYLELCDYTNGDTSGAVDMMWLSGGLRVTPMEQIDFLKKIYHKQLPFSRGTYDMMKHIMIMDETPEYTIRAKTGWSQTDEDNLGWYVGYVTVGRKVYYFSNTIFCGAKAPENFGQARKDIVYAVLRKMNIISSK